jgi:hypothetical protein
MANLKRTVKKMKTCEGRGHFPHRQAILVDYHPQTPWVTVQCMGCKQIYDRLPTEEDIKLYANLGDVVFTI